MSTASPDDAFADLLRRAGNWCQEYLELQHSRDVGAAFGDVMRTFAEIAAPQTSGGADRFERLKELERRLDRMLITLANAHQRSIVSRGDASQDQPDSGATRLFVYGTLKRGGCRAFALAGQRFLGTARTTAAYRMYHCGDYPALVRDANGISIEGELWEVDAACLARLDEIEGLPMRLYERAPISLLPPHEGAAAESYFYLRSVNGLRDVGPHWP